jgi:hypothetical protein
MIEGKEQYIAKIGRYHSNGGKGILTNKDQSGEARQSIWEVEQGWDAL